MFKIIVIIGMDVDIILWHYPMSEILPLNFESKFNCFCDLYVDCKKLAKSVFISGSKNTFSFPRKAIIVYRNCSVVFKILISLMFRREKNVMVVQMASRSGIYNQSSAKISEQKQFYLYLLFIFWQNQNWPSSDVLYSFSRSIPGQSFDNSGIRSKFSIFV